MTRATSEVKTVDFDRLFALSADVYVDAEQGRQLMRELEADGAFEDFAWSVADYEAHGLRYCPTGIDWEAVEMEKWGD